ncbi:MAG: menaquinol-cytochrome c reductase iron-sulfur subunit [Solirubrobacteraceae bacterium]|jgi:menaquinol-cytochrome c reductase iron-sulfur subunit|nr:menaquinol-cytochrome c reductase iron-sulfur subunit [Solirubrobacteraceae bacterium]
MSADAQPPEPPSRHRSKYTEDLGIPGAFEGETVSRRRFMTASVHTAGAIAAAAFTLPALGFALGPVFARTSVAWQDVGPLDGFSVSTYTPVTVTIEPGVGEAGKSTAFVRRHDPGVDGPVKDQYDEVVALSSRCAHVGCPVRFVAAASSFVCPCHGGVYDFRGIRVGGPPPRPLDRFYTLIRHNHVLLGPRFSVNFELRRFALRDPGEGLDGIGQFLYPPRFSTPPAPPGAKT